MSSREKKRKITMPQSNSILSLPEDLLLSCLARVSRLHYSTLSLVSKSFRSLLTSRELSKARSLLGNTESRLYVCFRWCHEYHWFTLCQKPNQTLTNNDTSNKKKPSRYVLARLPIHHSPVTNGKGLVSVGSNIYNIGGSNIFGMSSSKVSILDCLSHKWHTGPSLRAELYKISACVLDEKIYVAGRYRDGHCYDLGHYNHSLKCSLQVLDQKTQIWDPKPIPKGTNHNTSVCIDGKFHVEAGPEVVAYSPKEGRWDRVSRWDDIFKDDYCVIENVLYSVSHGRDKVHGAFTWYDTKVRTWRHVKDLVGVPKFSNGANVTLAAYGGKMAVLWDERLPRGVPLLKDNKKRIWCAVIALERRSSSEICGTVEWSDHVLTVPLVYDFVKALAVVV